MKENKNMKRREFIKTIATGIVTSSIGLTSSGCFENRERELIKKIDEINEQNPDVFHASTSLCYSGQTYCECGTVVNLAYDFYLTMQPVHDSFDDG